MPRVPVLFGLAALASAWLCMALPVFSQEAYYWTYAQHPDMSYFDHPPMVAWLIWLGTSVFGDGAFGLRFGTWVCGLGTTWFGLLLLRDFGVDHRGQGLWILFGIGSPILLVARVLTNPDPPLLCFWTLTLLALWRARSGQLGWWAIAGVAAGAALLSKYTAAFLAIGGLLMLLLDPLLRRQWRRPGPYLGVLLAFVTFLPVVIWNVNNDFESFRFQTANRFARGSLNWRWCVELISGQFGLLNPLLALLLPWSVWWLLRRMQQRDARSLLVLAFGLPLPCYMLLQSLWIQVKLNWLIPGYAPLLLGVALWWRESGVELRRPRLLRWVIGSMVLLQVAVVAAPLVRMMPPGRGSSWTGWDQIVVRAEHWEDRIDLEDGIEGNFFFFAADYRDAAQLGRNLLLYRRAEGGHIDPTELNLAFEPTMAQNVLGQDALQYDHWSAPSARIGQDALFVLPRPEGREQFVATAGDYFDRVEKVERVAVEFWGIHLFDTDLFVCRNYRGPKHRK